MTGSPDEVWRQRQAAFKAFNACNPRHLFAYFQAHGWQWDVRSHEFYRIEDRARLSIEDAALTMLLDND